MLINKKKIIILSTILIAIATYSYGTDSGVITGETVKLRSGASLDSKLVMLLSVNDKVEVLGQEGDWYKVKYKENTGYVYKDYIKVKQTETETTNQEDNNTVSENQTQETSDVVNETTNEVVNENITNTTTDDNIITIPSEKVISEDSTISILPLINSSSIAILNKGTKVTVIEYKNGWAYVVSSSSNGWIRKEKLQDTTVSQTTEKDTENKEDETEQQEKTEDSTNESTEENINKTAYVNVNSVRVRKAATTESEVIDSLVKNNQVVIIGEENGWYKVEVNGLEGYIAKQYLSDQKVEVTNRSSNVDRTSLLDDSKEVSKTEETSSSTSVNNKGNDIVKYAKTFLGSKYVSGGSTPETGFDCSGFTYYVYKHFGYTLNRASSAQAKNGIEVNKSDLKLGDLVLFSQGSKTIGHVGIYIGGNNFIHAANPTKGVVITSLSNSYYEENYVTARRIIY